MSGLYNTGCGPRSYLCSITTSFITRRWLPGGASQEKRKTIFQGNGAVTFGEGPSRCEPDDPQTTGANWSLSPDRQAGTYPEGDVESCCIGELTNQLFIVDYAGTIEDVTYTFTGTQVKQ